MLEDAGDGARDRRARRGVRYGGTMPGGPSDGGEVVCPHCGKHFTAPLLAGDSVQRGFKCPHCKLFVPLDRAEPAPG